MHDCKIKDIQGHVSLKSIVLKIIIFEISITSNPLFDAILLAFNLTSNYTELLVRNLPFQKFKEAKHASHWEEKAYLDNYI